MPNTTRKFEIRNQMGRGEVKATITIECETLTNAEEALVAIDMSAEQPGPIVILQMGPGFDHREVKA